MNSARLTIPLLLAAGLLLAPALPSHAQQTVNITPADTFDTTLAAFLSDTTGTLSPETRVDVDFKDASVRDALTKVLEQAGKKYVFDDDLPGDAKISLKIKNAPLATVLDLLTQTAGIGWRTEFRRRDEKSDTLEYLTVVHAGKTLSGSKGLSLFGSGINMNMYTDALKTLPRTHVISPSTWFGINGVSTNKALNAETDIDLKEVSARDAFIRVLETAKLKYVLDDDVPADVKINLTLKGVPVSTLLNLMARTAGVGWRSETRRTEEKDETGKVKAETVNVVHVGKTVHSQATAGWSMLSGFSDALPVMPSLNSPRGTTRIYTLPDAVNSGLFYRTTTHEQRTTITCPHCHNTFTMVQKSGQDTAATPLWKHCPVCGKEVKFEAKNKTNPRVSVEIGE